MTEIALLGSRPLPFEVVFWDSESPGYEGNRVRFCETRPPTNSGEAAPGWRSDRRCRSSREIGLRLEKPCRLHQITVRSEPELAPSSVSFFLAGPPRRGEQKLSRKRGVDERKWPKEPSIREGHDDYISSVFANIGRATFISTASNAKGPSKAFTASASLAGLSFKGQFLRLALAEPVGSHANPGRQVSVAHIQVLGCSLEDELNYRPQATSTRATRDTLSTSGQGELEGVLTELGIEPSLAAGGLKGGGAPTGGGRGEASPSLQRSGSRVERKKTGFVAGWEAGGVASEPALRAFKSVRGMLDAAHAEERFNEAEQLSLALNRVRSLGSKLCGARREQESASRREDFDEAKKFRDQAREAEIWLGQAVQEASEVFDNGAGCSPPGEIKRQGESSGEGHHHNGSVAATSGTGAAKETGVAPSHSIGGLRQADASERPPTSVSHRKPREVGEGGGDAQFLPDGSQEEHGRRGEDPPQQLETPPWLTPGCARSAKPWRALLGVPWPAGISPDFSTVFSHKWADNNENGTLRGRGAGGGGGGAGSSTIATAAAAAAAAAVPQPVASIPWSVEMSSGRSSPVPKPGTLLRTILRLVAASQDLRPPGPVPPDVTPFRLAGRADTRPSLCSFSATDGVASNGVSSRGRAFAYPIVDSTPCASHVTNWIEDNPRLAWGASHGHRRHWQHQFSTSAPITAVGTSEGKVNGHTTEGAAKTAGGKPGAGRPTEGGNRGRGDIENLEETATAAVSATKELSEEDMPFALPDVVGAGGFAELLPLLDATIGRVPMSAACAGFPARMREASISVCEAHLDLAADVAVKAYAAAADAAAPFNPSTGPTKGQNYYFHSPAAASSADHGIAVAGGSLAKREGDTADAAARGAVVRAGCLIAAQGLLDPAIGPRAAGESLAMSVLSLWAAPEGHEEKQPGKKGWGGRDEGATGCGSVGTTGEKGAVGSATAFLTQETFDEPGSVADGGGCEGAKLVAVPANDPPLAVPRNTVPLRDLRWGLELLLGCVAPHLADGVDGDDDRAESISGAPPAGQQADEERLSVAAAESRDEPGMVTDVSSVTFDGGSARDGTTAAAGSDCGGSEPPEKARSEMNPAGQGDEEGSRTACRLVDFACRHPDIGAALVASVLVSWIPHLADWGRRPAMSSATGKEPFAAGSSTRRPVAAFSIRKPEPCWQCAPAGETGASESLAAGAINMLVFMVRRFPLLPMSDFSAETLNCAAEGSMGFGVRGAGAGKRVGTVGKVAAGGVAARAGRSTSGRAQRAGEALMLELFLSRGGGGMDVLLPAVDSVRGLASLRERSVDSVNRVVAGMEPKGGEEAANVAAAEGSSSSRLVPGGDKCAHDPNTLKISSRDEWWVTSGRRKHLVAAKLEVRKRLPVPPPPTPLRRPSGPSALGNEPLETIHSAGDDTTAGKCSDPEVFSLSDSTSGLTLVDTSLSSGGTYGVDFSQTSSDSDRRKKGVVGDKGHVPQSAVPGGDPDGARNKRGSGAGREESAQSQQANQSATSGKRTSTGKGNKVVPLARSSGDSFTDSEPREGDSTPVSPRKDSDASGSRGASAGSHEGERTHAEDSDDSASTAFLEKDAYERVPWRVPKPTTKRKKRVKGIGWMSRMFRRGK